jgi:hypothetical protein
MRFQVWWILQCWRGQDFFNIGVMARSLWTVGLQPVSL